MAKTTTTTTNTFLHHLGESKSRELNASQQWLLVDDLHGAPAHGAYSHWRRKLTGALWKSELRSAASCKLSCAVLSCWSCCLVVVRKPQQRLVFHLFSLHSNSSGNSCLGNAIEQEFHIVFTASRRCWQRGTLAEPGSILSVKTIACWQQGRVQFFRISRGNWRSCRERKKSIKLRVCYWKETNNLKPLNKILYIKWDTKDRTS